MVKQKEKKEFVGMSWGKKVYLTPKEQKVIAEQQKRLANEIWTVAGWVIGLGILSIIVIIMIAS